MDVLDFQKSSGKIILYHMDGDFCWKVLPSIT
jgi:hypothetical protein